MLKQLVLFGLCLAGLMLGVSPIIAQGVRPVNIALRPNPHLKKRPVQPVSVVEAPKISLISHEARKQFCLNVRGWAVPTPSFFAAFEELLQKKAWTEPDKKMLRYWLDRGFGFAIGHLIQATKPAHMVLFQKMMRQEYPDTNAICPLACSYRDYIEVRTASTADEFDMLQDLCRPDCRIKKTSYTNYEAMYCDCLASVDSIHCAALSASDQRSLNHSRGRQETLYQDYQHRMKRKLISGDSVDAIESRKIEMMNNLKSLVER